MNRFLKIVGYVLLTGSLFSCEDVFNQRILIDIPSGPEKMVLLANFENRNSPVVLLSVSGADYKDLYNYGGNYKPGPDAEVEVLEDGISLGTMKRDTLSTYIFADQFIPQTGKNYEIRVRAKEYGEIRASGSIPPAVPIHAEVTGKTRSVRYWGSENEAHEIKLSFADLPDQANFYRISLMQHIPSTTDSLAGLSGVHFYSDDLIFSSATFFGGGSEPGALQYISGSRVFNDHSFNGTVKEVSVYVMVQNSGSADSEMSTEIILKLEHLSKDTYEYEFTRRQAWQNEDNPFVQPVIIHNNIRGGGLGAFNTYNISWDRVKLRY